MADNKTSKQSTEARGIYEPVQVKVMKVTPQGVLCQSGGGSVGGPLMGEWGSGSSSSGSL